MSAESAKRIDAVIHERPIEETVAMYDEFATTYDQDADATGLGGHQIAVNCLDELGLSKNISILDVGTGTGKLGTNLSKLGYNNLHALDGSKKMLEVAKKRKVYSSFTQSYLGGDYRVPLPDNKFDAAVMASVFCPGHMGPDIFPELIRLVKPGGVICWGQRAPHLYADRSSTFKDGNFHKSVLALCQSGHWEIIKGPLHIEVYNEGMPGLVYAMRVKQFNIN